MSLHFYVPIFIILHYTVVIRKAIRVRQIGKYEYVDIIM